MKEDTKVIEKKEQKQKKTVTFMPEALEKIKSILKEEGKEKSGLRVVIGSGGCCGSFYQMGIEDEKMDGDTIIDASGMKIYLDAGSHAQLDDMKIEYISDDVEEGFKITNGKEKDHKHSHGHDHGCSSDGSCGGGGCGGNCH